MMKKTLGFVLTAFVLVAGFLFAAYWLDRTSYVDTPDLPRPDPTAVGASVQSNEVPRGEGPVLIGEIQNQPEEATGTPVPFFWMAIGALCAGIGVFIATRDRKPKGNSYSYRDYR